MADSLIYAMGPDDRSVPDAPADVFFTEKLVNTSASIFDAALMAGIKRAVLLGSYFNYFHRKWPHLNWIKSITISESGSGRHKRFWLPPGQRWKP